MSWLDVVRKPKRRSRTGGCLPARFFCKDRRAETVLGKNDTTRKSRYARTNDSDRLCHMAMV